METTKKSTFKVLFYLKKNAPKKNGKVTVMCRITIDNYSWEEIQEQNLYDKRYSFTLDELNAINWELVYDGN